MIIDFHQLSHYYNIYALPTTILTKLKFILNTNENDTLFEYCSKQQYKEQTYNYFIYLLLLAYVIKMKEPSKRENFKSLQQIKLLRKNSCVSN